MTNKTADQTVAAWEARETDMAKIARLVADPHSDALAAKDREIERLRTLYEEQLDHCASVIAKQDGHAEAMRAKCEEIARTSEANTKIQRLLALEEYPQECGYFVRGEQMARRIGDAITALKAK